MIKDYELLIGILLDNYETKNEWRKDYLVNDE